ncbi:Rieske (2Fe-2S) iron-sulfur domain protein [Pseudonocardia dioxanivorans CB1190]|uniref:Rieske (2Fe-2S) iron-sulfur domain protein n=1 Tax=Pseudonocardia dioxanivorans (strain ATCC 55486 / DSM 44775 / JCM 13855 / CB1190) TaxID=675635 RepID=F4CK63_PSEUX|nr:Rieske 2Fe-2S domain-containing protein [Pseudonocardia dioxanivorans]AEA28169.1 Rieske (2Fe-2S) iron-sulfur domain protein [Pseudonocardia dioxanivorans CB1190]
MSDENETATRQEEDRWVTVASMEDLWEGDLQAVAVDGEEVLLVHLESGELRAYQGTCPHQERTLGDSDLDGDLLVCTGHHWEFDARTGNGLNPMGCKLFTYPVRADGEDIQILLPPPGTPRHYRYTATLEPR